MNPRLIITEEPITPGRLARASRTFCRTVQALHQSREIDHPKAKGVIIL
jgi:hypothetical protein